jgi:hypothetical protein
MGRAAGVLERGLARTALGDYSLQELRERISSAASRNPWHFEAGSEPVRLTALMSPLRFDIAVRVEYLRFLRSHRELLERDLARYLQLARAHPYFTWFTRIWCRAFAPHLLSDHELLEKVFRERVLATARLEESFERHGFDPGHRITLRTGREVLPSVTGKHVERTYFAGDGCHRLALLIEAGYDELPADWYRVKRYRRFTPTDTTLPLLEALRPSPEEYFRFLSVGYGVDPAPTREHLLDVLSGCSPETRREVERVIERDEPALGQ